MNTLGRGRGATKLTLSIEFSDRLPHKRKLYRSLRKIFTSCEALQDSGWKYTKHESFFEIYKYKIKVLLVPDDVGSHEIHTNASEETFV